MYLNKDIRSVNYNNSNSRNSKVRIVLVRAFYNKMYMQWQNESNNTSIYSTPGHHKRVTNKEDNCYN